MTIKNIKIEGHEDDFSGAYSAHNIRISTCLVTKIKSASDHIWKFNADWPEEEANIVFPFSKNSCDSETLQPYSIHVGNSGFYFRVCDNIGISAETETLPFEALGTERFMLYFGDDREIYEFDPNEDDIDDFEAIYANSLNEARNALLENVALAREAHGEHEEAESIRLLKR